jgi:hypothetical protein
VTAPVAGRPLGFRLVCVFALLLATVQSWVIASSALRAAAGRDAARAGRRESVRYAVSRISPRE